MINLRHPSLSGRSVLTDVVGHVHRHSSVGDLLWVGRAAEATRLSPPSDVFGAEVDWVQGQASVGTLPRYLVRLEGARLYYPFGFIQLRSGEFLRDSYWLDDQLDFNALSSKRAWFQRTQRGEWFSLAGMWSDAYYHWFCETLLRLHAVLQRLPVTTRFVIPASATQWMYRSLERLGIAASRCVPYASRHPWQFESLYFSGPVAWTGDQDAAALKWLSQALSEAVELPRKRIYVSRRNARCRRVVNEEQLAPLLLAHGFETVCMEDLSFDEQIALIGEASIVVGPHGAGLTNCIFQPACGTVCEIIEPSTARRCFYSMARALERRYLCLVGRAVPSDGDEPDVYVDRDSFACLLDEAVSSQG